MTGGALIGVAALILSALTVYLTVGPMRTRLRSCEHDRLELRRRLELVTAAIIATLPREQRINLLADLDERWTPLPPHGAA